MARRLDLHPKRKLRNPERHMRSFRRAMDRIEMWFPKRESWSSKYENVKVPVFQKAVSVRQGHPRHRREVVVRLIRAATRIAHNRGTDAPTCQVAAVVCWPDVWPSEVCVFFDQAYAESFQQAPKECSRRTFERGWLETSPTQTDLLQDLEIELPHGFEVSGRVVRDFTEADPAYPSDQDFLYENEHWMIAESTPEAWRTAA